MKVSKKTEIDPTTWVDLHGDYLYRYALLRVSHHQIAEDLVQDTFLSALGSLDNFRGESQIRTWLTGILKRKIIDYYRKKQISYSLNSDGIPQTPEDFEAFGSRQGAWKMENAPKDWGNSPDKLFENQQFMKILERCIGDLPERLSAVFVLREMDGYDTKEICKLLDISPSNLWVILHRARHLLRKCLEINWIELEKKQK